MSEVGSQEAAEPGRNGKWRLTRCSCREKTMKLRNQETSYAVSEDLFGADREARGSDESEKVRAKPKRDGDSAYLIRRSSDKIRCHRR